MRRGHPGIGGWRGENTRHFRPRSGGSQHFRPPRSFGLLDNPRYPPPGSRFQEISPYNTRSESAYKASEHHDRNKYRLVNKPSSQRPERSQHGQRGNYPHLSRRHGDESNYSQYQESRIYHENIQSEPYLVNSMGDVDHRQLMTTPKPREPYSHHRMPVWNQNESTRSYYDDRNQNKNYLDSARSGKLPVTDYVGHRPPASDHFVGNTGQAIDGSNSFSCSLDDTVDLVRQRLMKRKELEQQHSGDQPTNQTQEHQETLGHNTGNYQSTQDTPSKKRVERRRPSVRSNCKQIKNKIVHQLFKMDKDKIHKIMDNPNSSTKFEYAISSLITESRNSFSRHMRSVAEKSLTTSSDFINNDSNTIYEDTFLKQMEGILDPQDTMILEDIKPLVMEELSKVLETDNYDQPQENTEGNVNYYDIDDRQCETTDNSDIYNEYSYEANDPQNYELQNPEMNVDKNYQYVVQTTEPLFERRPADSQSSKSQERRFSMEQRRLSRQSIDRRSTENPYSQPDAPVRNQHRQSTDRKSYGETEIEPLPIFDSNTEHFSEDEDPFADLDKQYHVAVDHNFIQSYDASPQTSVTSSRSKSPPPINKEGATPIKMPDDIKNEIDSQLFKIAKSPLELTPSLNETSIMDIQVKLEPSTTPIKISASAVQINKENASAKKTVTNEDVVLESNDCEDTSSQHRYLDQRTENYENNSTSIKKSLSGSSRKRSLDQRPSHRKEKRKKSDSNQTEPSKQILNKNIIINVNDCAAKKNEKCAEAATKSIFNLFFSKEKHSNDPAKDSERNKIESTEKKYSEKYVKRKEQPNVSKDAKQIHSKRHRSVSSSHSTVSPRANNNNTSSNSSSSQPSKSNKSEPKNKLKHIDMFTEQARKVNVHQSNRNTALPPKTPETISEENKTKHLTFDKVKKVNIAAKMLVTRDTQTYDIKRSRFSQTDKKKIAVKATQTDPVTPEKTGAKSTETFERMKEIDLEIQVLLQEKFKLYSSLESKDTSQTLGMTVLNVPFDEDKEQAESLSESEDAIVEDFTNIPVEELEQIALESVEDTSFETPRSKKNQRQKVLSRERTSSRSPLLKKNSKKGKGPNISLIEQIITDDRPLEDIISLDDFEYSPFKPKKKSSIQKQAKSKKKPNNKKKSKETQHVYNSIIFPEGLHLKECCVVLKRDEIENYLKSKRVPEPAFVKHEDEPAVIVESIPVFADTEIESMCNVIEREETIQETIVNEDSVNVNDIHFDMLDVSEDIVIGDVCDVKSNDKEIGERLDVSISEEIILDNSQSSLNDVVQPEPSSQYKMFDFSADESLRRDSYTVTSNPDAVLALECVENNFLAACLDGNVYHYSSDGQLLATLRGYNQPVTCLIIIKEKYGTTVYTGSLDSRIRYYDLESGMEKGPECNVLSPIQSMDRAWDTVFVGTRTGFVLQFECKNNMLIPVSTVKFSEQSILALRAMKEGPRKVLLVAARSEDVTVKDAQTGLLLRTLSGPKMTVYSLLFEDGKVYCGTSSHQIHVFDYASSSHLATHEGGKGVVCLRASGGLLFAGCYDGCVYVFRENESRPLAQLRGPGIMLLSLAIVGSKIIAGYKDRGLHIWKIPLVILKEMIL